MAVRQIYLSSHGYCLTYLLTAVSDKNYSSQLTSAAKMETTFLISSEFIPVSPAVVVILDKNGDRSLDY